MANSDSLYLSVMKKKVRDAYSLKITLAPMDSKQSISSIKLVTKVVVLSEDYWAPNY